MEVDFEYVVTSGIPCSSCGKVTTTVSPLTVFSPVCRECLEKAADNAQRLVFAVDAALFALEVHNEEKAK